MLTVLRSTAESVNQAESASPARTSIKQKPRPPPGRDLDHSGSRSRTGDGGGQRHQVTQTGELGVEELRTAAAADHDDRVAVDAGAGVERVLVALDLEAHRPLDLAEREVLRCGLGRAQRVAGAVDPDGPVGAERL